jgi:hypothetical protein
MTTAAEKQDAAELKQDQADARAEAAAKAKEPVVLNVYKVNYTKVRLDKVVIPASEDKKTKESTKWVPSGAGVDGSMTVVAESPTEAGVIAHAEHAGEGIDYNVHAVHELAKNVILPGASKNKVRQ